ncbi:hypothetical protein F7Y47_15100 [Vibrio sp. 1-2-3a]|nr:hypothetical protein F6W79_23400 [Vibrio diabolicus]MDU9592981.1 hypothetical protein [Vibrio sp. 2-1-2a]MDU9603739.1 hypothetical protein [Vibrio sp. 1-2-3a]NNN81209.1 hypothetical protein [Vibrio sp. 11-4(1)]PLX64416.1 MAG: hypothetical protein C0632_06700 [Vibrio alginolyticus]
MNKASDLLTGGGAILAKAGNADKGKLVKNQCQCAKRSKKGQKMPFSFTAHFNAMINNLLLQLRQFSMQSFELARHPHLPP